MVVYWDTSAIIRNPGEAHSLLREERSHFTLSYLTEMELLCALTRIQQQGWSGYTKHRHTLLRIHTRLLKVSLQKNLSAVFASAPLLAGKHVLGSHDCLHLAAALRLREARHESACLASYDRKLRETAVAEGLAVFPDSIGNGR